jgi:dsDNA-specific endonuclease/ATPase MutS2
MWLEVVKIKFLDWEQREQVGFSFIIDKLDVITSFGIEEKKSIKTYKDRSLLIEELKNVELLIASISQHKDYIDNIQRVFCRLKDLRSTLNRCKDSITLDEVELFEIKSFALLMEELLSAYNSLGIAINSISFISLEKVTAILDPEHKRLATFHIYEQYSEKLKCIRQEKRKLEAQIYKERDAEKALELKEKRLQEVLKEEEEELAIRRTLTKALRSYVAAMEENTKSIGRLDFLIAKAKLAVEYNAVKPAITEKFMIKLTDMYNPQVVDLLKIKQKKFTPITISLEKGASVITGANMGGKSVALKTTVLNLLLAQFGFFVFAKAAELPVVDFIYFISDDMQDISQGLSTFGAEIIRLKEVIEDAKGGQGFIALDEFARGTNPKEGIYLLKALCRYLNGLNSISLISTHYDKIVDKNMVHYQVTGLKNINLEALKHRIDLNRLKSIDILQENMEYTIERVSEKESVPKDALNIATLLGLQSEIIESARVFYEEGMGEKNG